MDHYDIVSPEQMRAQLEEISSFYRQLPLKNLSLAEVNALKISGDYYCGNQGN